MKKAKEILDRHLMSKNTNTGHIHIVAYMAALDAVKEALNTKEKEAKK